MADESSVQHADFDDVIEEGRFTARFLAGEEAIGEYYFEDIGPLAQFGINVVKRRYGQEPREIKRLGTNLNFEPLKFVTSAFMNDATIFRLADRSRPRTGRKSTPTYTIEVAPLDRNLEEPWKLTYIDAFLYSFKGWDAKASDAEAKCEFMVEFFDWSDSRISP